MKVTEAEQRLRFLLSEAGFGVDQPDPVLAWEVFKRFVKEPVDCLDDSVLFQCGVHALWPEERFNLDFVRQFSIAGQGEDERMEQLRIEFLCPATAARRRVEKNLWADGFPSLEDYFIAVESLPEFREGLEQGPWTCEVRQRKV